MSNSLSQVEHEKLGTCISTCSEKKFEEKEKKILKLCVC